MGSPYSNAWERLVAETGSVEAAKEEMKKRRAKVNPKNIKGRPSKKLGSNAQG